MVKSLNEHRNNIKPEVRAAAKAKAMDIVGEMSSAKAKKAKEIHNTPISDAHKDYEERKTTGI